MEDGRAIPRKKMVYQPTQEEWDEHMRIHIPCRAWCPCCLQGKSVSGIHRRTQKSEEEKQQEGPTMRRDYMGPKSKDDKSDKIDSLPILAGVDGRKWKCAHMVQKK